MSEFTHSEILFSGDDGLPLEFNVQYAKDKAVLKPLIEHGGGLCTLSDDAIYLVSPGTTVLNVNQSKNLITTSYIYDCVKQNYLLDTDEYRLVINEMEISDISDTSQNLIGDQSDLKSKDEVVNDSVDIIGCNKTVSPTALTCPQSNHDFDFLDSENPNHFANNNIENIQNNNSASSLTPDEICEVPDVNEIEKGNNEAVINAVPDSLESIPSSVNIRENQIPEIHNIAANNQILNDNIQGAMKLNIQNTSADAVIVSSSQPNEGVLDQFDNMVLIKAQDNPVQNDDECLSQSYTVSSSADAQVSPKVPVHNISAEIFDGSPNAPDSASQTTERQQYINDLEKEIEQILLKPSPKSIQDKITLVKYVCIAKKLPLAVGLHTLQKFTTISEDLQKF